MIVAGELVDFFWPAARLMVEADSYGFHRGRARFESDRLRDAVLLLAGFRVLRLTQLRIEREPERVAQELAAAAPEPPCLRAKEAGHDSTAATDLL